MPAVGAARLRPTHGADVAGTHGPGVDEARPRRLRALGSVRPRQGALGDPATGATDLDPDRGGRPPRCWWLDSPARIAAARRWAWPASASSPTGADGFSALGATGQAPVRAGPGRPSPLAAPSTRPWWLPEPRRDQGRPRRGHGEPWRRQEPTPPSTRHGRWAASGAVATAPTSPMGAARPDRQGEGAVAPAWTPPSRADSVGRPQAWLVPFAPGVASPAKGGRGANLPGGVLGAVGDGGRRGPDDGDDCGQDG